MNLLNLTFVGAMALALPAYAQTNATGGTTEAPATTGAQGATGLSSFTPPAGYDEVQINTLTADQMAELKLYDHDGTEIGTVSGTEAGEGNAVTSLTSDVGTYVGKSGHSVKLMPDDIRVYRNADGELRGYLSKSKDDLSALPAQ